MEDYLIGKELVLRSLGKGTTIEDFRSIVDCDEEEKVIKCKDSAHEMLFNREELH